MIDALSPSKLKTTAPKIGCVKAWLTASRIRPSCWSGSTVMTTPQPGFACGLFEPSEAADVIEPLRVRDERDHQRPATRH